MAGIGTITDVINNLPNIFYDKGQYLWNRQALHTMMSAKKAGRGASVNWTVSNGGITVLNRGPGYTVTPSTDATNDDRVKATLNRGIYSTSFGFTDNEIATVQSFLGSDSLADIVRDLFQDAYVEHLAALMRQIELDVLVGTGTASGQNNIVGFLTALQTSGTYAGVTFGGSTNAGFISNLIVPAGGNITRAYCRQMFAKIKQATGYLPDYIECSPLTATYINGIGDVQIRYPNDAQSRELFNQGALPSMSGSTTSILGVPVYENTAWGASTSASLAANADGYVLFGTRNKSLFDVLTYTPAQDAFLSAIKSGLSADSQEAVPVGLPVRCWAQAKTAASIVVNMDIELAMAITAPNAFGLMTGVTGYTPDTLDTHSV